MNDFLVGVETSAQGRREATAYAWGVAYRAACGDAYGLGGRASGILSGALLRQAAANALDALTLEALADGNDHGLRILRAYSIAVHGDPFDVLDECDCGECYWNRQEA